MMEGFHLERRAEGSIREASKGRVYLIWDKGRERERKSFMCLAADDVCPIRN